MDRMAWTYAILFALCFSVGFGDALYAQPTSFGGIKGRIIDKNSRETLPSVNVIVKGTYYGAASDLNGNFVITRMNPGSYVVEITLLGYKTVQYGSVRVAAGSMTELTVEMEETALSIGQEVIIIGEKPLFDIQETSSRAALKAEDIQLAGLQNIKDIVATQVGVVKSDDQIFIRGSRGYENAYLVDGISVQDPLAGTGIGIQVPPAAIQEVEVITGGYNAEYGQATSGVISFTTKEGGDKFDGGVTFKKDDLGFNHASRSNFNTDIVETYLSGPEPLTTYILPALGVDVPGKITFFANANVNLTDGYTRWVEVIDQQGKPIGHELRSPGGLYSSIFNGSAYAPRRSNLFAVLGKLTWKPSPVFKLSYTGSQSIGINQNTQTIQVTLERQEPMPGYQYLFQNIPDSANTFTQINTQHAFQLTHTLSAKTFYEIRLSRYTARVRGDANGKNWNEYREPKDIVNYPVVYFNTNTDTIGVIPGDGFYDLGSPTQWRDHYVGETTFKLDLNHHFTEMNKFKAGAEFRFQELQMVDIVNPWVRPLGFNNDIYSVFPAMGAFYGQNAITFGGMILNFGLRLDYWFPGKFVDDAVNNEAQTLVAKTIRDQYKIDTYELFGQRMKARLSPRLAIAHPITDNQTLFFSYGHFSKFPRPQYVYSKLLRSNARSSAQVVGNPNLNPETTVAYELGIRNQITENDIVTVTAYYKDIFDYITARSVRSLASRFSSGSYLTYINLDYARSRGLEMEYKTRIGNRLRINTSLSYSIATGKSSAANEALFNIQQGDEDRIKETYLVWDRPFNGSVTVIFRVRKGDPLFGIGEGILDDYSFYSRFFMQSGRRYTPQILIGHDATTGRPLYRPDPARPFESIGKNIYNFDMNFEKYFDIGPIECTIGLEVRNVFNFRNVQIVNPVTGEAYEYLTNGQPTPTPSSWNDPHYPDLQAPVDPFPYNPARYDAPRNYRVSFGVRF